MDGIRKLPLTVALVVLGASVMLVGGFWFGVILVSCGLIGLLHAYWQDQSVPDGARLDREWTRRQAVFWALAVSGGAPLGRLIVDALQGDLSWTQAAIFLVVWAVLFAVFLLSVWGRVAPRRRQH